MKYILTIFLLFTGITDPVTKIAKSNKLKREAKVAYEAEEYEKAVEYYGELLDSLQNQDPAARMNMANAAYLISYGGENLGLMSDISAGKKRVQDTASLNAITDQLRYFDIADANYRQLKDDSDPIIASSSYNQMGIIDYKKGEQSPDEKESFIQSSLSNFKQALRRNPQNESARYNYELLKKLIRKKKRNRSNNSRTRTRRTTRSKKRKRKTKISKTRKRKTTRSRTKIRKSKSKTSKIRSSKTKSSKTRKKINSSKKKTNKKRILKSNQKRKKTQCRKSWTS